ncbi:hypothetical protein F1C76_20285 [Geodermatophilaceae bacterium NBWT11]|nr:hypothetical protein F1C76_20285 [Geodermatophilaceae bacterium NBWT11]
MARALEVDVTEWTTLQLEARGSGANRWLEDGGGASWLYKATRIPTRSSEPQGEDWAEKVAHGLAELIGLPCADVELAFRDTGEGREPGVICRDLAGPGLDLQNGAILLQDVPGYRYREVHEGRLRPPRNHVGHSVSTVVQKLRSLDVMPPAGWDVPGVTAVGLFAGYLVFDAWISNLDRHEENWALLVRADGSVSLAPSYDHGASLGSALTEVRRQEIVAEPVRLVRFTDKAYGRKFQDGHKTPLTAFATAALDEAGEEARRHWSGRLARVSTADVDDVLSGVPRMSDPARTFCRQLLHLNREGVLDVCR